MHHQAYACCQCAFSDRFYAFHIDVPGGLVFLQQRDLRYQMENNLDTVERTPQTRPVENIQLLPAGPRIQMRRMHAIQRHDLVPGIKKCPDQIQPDITASSSDRRFHVFPDSKVMG